MYEYNAKVLRVLDGDTIEAEIDLGFNIRYTSMIRFYGINAPEIKSKDIKEVEKGIASKNWLIQNLPEWIILQTLKDRKDTFGSRILGIIKIGERNINDEMVSLGLASKYTF